MAKKIVAEFELKGNADEKVLNFKTALKEANAELLQMRQNFGDTSNEAIEAAQKVAGLKDAIGDAKAQADAFQPGGGFRAVAQAGQVAASGFAAAQGAMALFGAESEDVQKTLLKVQSAMALADGIGQLADAGDAFSNLKAVAVNAFNGIKAAIGSTGIGLLVIALGAIYTYWDDIEEAVSGVSAEQKRLNAETQKNVDIENEKVSQLGNQDNILKLQGKSEREILQIKNKQIDAAIRAAEIQISNQKVANRAAEEGAKKNYSLLKSYIDFVSMPLDLLYTTAAKGINGLIKLINKIPGVDIDVNLDENLVKKGADMITKLVFDPEKTKAKGEEVLKEQNAALLKLQNDKAGNTLAMQAIDKTASDKANADNKAANQKTEEENKRQAEALEKIRQDTKNANDKSDAEAIDKQKAFLQRQFDEANLSGQARIDAQKKLNEDLLALDQKKIDDKAALDKEKLDEDLAKLKLTGDAEIEAKKLVEEQKGLIDQQAADKKVALAQSTADKQKAIDDQAMMDKITKAGEEAQNEDLSFEERRNKLTEQANLINADTSLNADTRKELLKANSEAVVAIDKAEVDAKQENLAKVSGFLKNAASALGESTVAGKAAAIAATTIDTYQSATSAYKSMSGIPVVGPALGFAAAGLAVVSGIANVKKILSVKTPGGGGGGSAPSPATTPAPPTFNVVGNSGVNQIADTIASAKSDQPVVKAYVTSGDVTTAQSLDRNIVSNASLG